MRARPPRFVASLPLVFAFTLGGPFACDRAPRRPVPSQSPQAIARAPLPIVAPPTPPPTPAPPARPRLAVVYSSDLRGRLSPLPSPKAKVLPPGVTLTPLAARVTRAGLARRASVVDRARLEAVAVVQVDAGDFLPLANDEPRDAAAPSAKDSAKGPAWQTWIDVVLAAHQRLGVDAVTLGERELALGADPRKLAARLEKAKLPVVLANLVDRKGARVFPGDKLVAKNGLSVGVLGVSEPGEAATAALAKAGYQVTDATEAARAAASGLRARGAAFVIALVHTASGRARAAAIVAGLTDIDVAVASLGHDGEAAPGAARPLVVAAGGADTVGRLDVRLPEGGGPAALTDGVRALDESVPEQLGVGLLARLATIPMFDSDKLFKDASRKGSHVRMNDIYEQWDYGSTKACGYCHEKTVKQWQTTDHAHALATLKKAKHDRDPACLGCHVMGFLQPGGTRDWIMVAGGFADVGCESCHGPSALHVRSVDKKLGTNRKVDPLVCLGCHTPDWSADFDPIASMKEILGPGHGAP